MTSREIMNRALDLEHPERVPRDLWTLPVAEAAHPGAADAIRADFTLDIAAAAVVHAVQAALPGQRYTLPADFRAYLEKEIE